MSGVDKQEVQDKLSTLRHQVATNTLAEPSKQSTQQFLDHWLGTSARQRVAASTLMLYRGILESHVYPMIGQLPVQKLKPSHIQGVLDAMVNRSNTINETDGPRPPSADRSKQLLYSVLKKAFSVGVRLQILVTNPCEPIERPKAAKKEIHPLDADQAKRFLKAAEGTTLYPFFLVALETGARMGELRALRLTDLNLKEGTISISRSVSRSPDGEIEKTPKTAKGKRQVTLPSRSLAVLLKLQRERSKAEGPRALVFSAGGGRYRSRNGIRDSFRATMKRAGLLKALPKARTHDLRHTHATLLLLRGEHPKVVQERLGHATIAVTMDTYSHVLPTMQVDAAAKLDRLFA